MGLDLELFEDTIEPSLLCSICQKVFVDPVTNACQHVFCQSCIRKRLGSSRTRFCPQCSTKLLDQSAEVSVELKLKLLGLRIKCSHGCGTVCLLADLPDHVSDVCPEAPVQCPNKDIGCTKTVKRREVQLHEEECYHRYVDCEACGYRVQYCDLFTHQSKKKCLEKKLRQQVARAAKSTNMEVRRHRDNVTRQHLQLERLKKEALMRNFRSKQNAKMLTPRRIVSKTNGELDGAFEIDVLGGTFDDSDISSMVSSRTLNSQVIPCKNCGKSFRETKNHDMACCYHSGVSCLNNNL